MGGKGKRSDRGEGPFHFLPLPRKRGVGRGKSRSHFVQLTRRCERSPGGLGQRRELESLASGGTEGGACAHAQSASRRRGRAAGGHCLARRGCGPTLRGRFCFKGRACGRCRIWARPVPCEGRRDCRRVCAPAVRRGCAERGLVPEVGVQVARLAGEGRWSGPPAHLCNLHL